MQLLPTARPRITRQEVDILLASKNIVVNQAMLIFIRGYYKNSMGKPGINDIGIYDDAAILVSPRITQTFNANTDPHKAGQRLAMLAPGLYKFYKGDHHVGTPRAYKAFRPYPEGVRNPCTRDGVTSTCANTNIHRGGVNDTFSEGCLTIPPNQYDEFLKAAYAEMDRYGQKTIDVLLIEE